MMMSSAAPSTGANPCSAAPRGPCCRPGDQVPEHLIADAAQVGRSGPKIRVAEGFPGRGRCAYGRGPCSRRRQAAGEDALARRRQQRLVLEEEQVRVEDRGLVRTGTSRQ